MRFNIEGLRRHLVIPQSTWSCLVGKYTHLPSIKQFSVMSIISSTITLSLQIGQAEIFGNYQEYVYYKSRVYFNPKDDSKTPPPFSLFVYIKYEEVAKSKVENFWRKHHTQYQTVHNFSDHPCLRYDLTFSLLFI